MWRSSLWGVESEGGSTEAVRQKNAEAVQAAVEFLTGMGVAEADIRTDSVNLSERYGGGYEMSTRSLCWSGSWTVPERPSTGW